MRRILSVLVLFTICTIVASKGFVGVAYPVSVEVIGTLKGGGTVTETFIQDGIIDGSGLLDDFQAAILPASFQNLVSVEFVWSGSYNDYHSIDNIALQLVPQPLGNILNLYLQYYLQGQSKN